jgi:hypothetical protein
LAAGPATVPGASSYAQTCPPGRRGGWNSKMHWLAYVSSHFEKRWRRVQGHAGIVAALSSQVPPGMFTLRRSRPQNMQRRQSCCHWCLQAKRTEYRRHFMFQVEEHGERKKKCGTKGHDKGHKALLFRLLDGLKRTALSLLKRMAGTTRLELATSAVTGQRSNQLNYVPARDYHDLRKSQCLCGSAGFSYTALCAPGA